MNPRLQVPEVPAPGSDEAIKRGCICPVMDNGHGRRSDGNFVMVLGCPVHAPQAGNADD